MINLYENLPSGTATEVAPSFTAQEVQMAYIIMAMEQVKMIRGLSPNHALIDKAKKMKELGFINSEEVMKAAQSEQEVETLKCYNFFQTHFPGCLIISEKDFIELNQKYGLVCGKLSAYKGDVPMENLDEILKVQSTLKTVKYNPYTNHVGFGVNRLIVELIEAASVRQIVTMERSVYGGMYEARRPDPAGLNYLNSHKARINAYPFKHSLSMPGSLNSSRLFAESDDLFIAAPLDKMTETIKFTVPETKMVPINPDPFVFQVSPIGVVIYSKWGEEAEDDIFDNIKPL